MAPTLPLSIRTTTDASGVLSIEIVDQLLLPHIVKWVPVQTPEDAFDAIKSMKVRLFLVCRHSDNAECL